jgi:hypothetical protein
MEYKMRFSFIAVHLIDERRYGADCTVFWAHGGVATPWNGITIPRPCALPCAQKTAHSTPSNYRF